MPARSLLFLLLFLPTSLLAAPAVSFEGSTVKAAGITPAGKVVFFSVSREGQRARLRMTSREEIVEDSDKDGVVELDLGQPTPFRSIWAAVDLASGEYTIASPSGYAPTVLEFPVAGLRRPAGAGKPDRLDDRRYSLEVLVVRPGQGAWRQSLGDGDPDDQDHAANGRVEWAVAKGRAIHGGPAAPDGFDPGDVIIAIDPTRMELYATRLPGGGR
ncbi:MAG: hypothetical protein ACJ75H_04940 [Thermoanaerobaculia bacterium]